MSKGHILLPQPLPDGQFVYLPIDTDDGAPDGPLTLKEWLVALIFLVLGISAGAVLSWLM